MTSEACGGQMLIMFLYLPHIVVAVVLLLALWKWHASPSAKAATVAAVLLSSAVLFAANYAIQYGSIRFPFGNDAYLLVVVAQLAIPGAVGVVCARRVKRRSQAPE